MNKKKLYQILNSYFSINFTQKSLYFKRELDSIFLLPSFWHELISKACILHQVLRVLSDAVPYVFNNGRKSR
jgi:hypothetical protein